MVDRLMTSSDYERLRDIIKAADRRYQLIFDEQRRAVDAAFVASDRATLKAEIAMEKRLDSMNEFRQQLTDQSRTFMPRDETLQRLDAIGVKLDALERRMTDRIEVAQRDGTGTHEVLTDKIDVLNTRIDKRDGEMAGAAANFNKLIAFVGLVGAVLTIIVLVANHVI